jgi:hypothetical protein
MRLRKDMRLPMRAARRGIQPGESAELSFASLLLYISGETNVVANSS